MIWILQSLQDNQILSIPSNIVMIRNDATSTSHLFDVFHKGTLLLLSHISWKPTSDQNTSSHFRSVCRSVGLWLNISLVDKRGNIKSPPWSFIFSFTCSSPVRAADSVTVSPAVTVRGQPTDGGLSPACQQGDLWTLTVSCCLLLLQTERLWRLQSCTASNDEFKSSVLKLLTHDKRKKFFPVEVYKDYKKLRF